MTLEEVITIILVLAWLVTFVTSQSGPGVWITMVEGHLNDNQCVY
jgi:hypothetical protein